MKHFFIVTLLVFMATTSAFAGWGGPGKGPADHGLPEAGQSGSDLVSITITGTLEVINGQLAVRDGSDTYFVKGLSRLMRSVPGLVVGVRVSLHGWSSKIMDDGVATGHYFNARQLTFNGQTYAVIY
jgi:hypothetical protein